MKRALIAASALLLVGAAVYIAPTAAHHLLPLSWTGEATRLAEAIGAHSGDRIAEIGAGGGAMAEELAKVVGPKGVIFATEMSEARRRDLQDRAARLPQIMVVEAKEHSTNLESACCTAIYMRNVLHHISDWPAYAQDLARTVRPGGVVAVIDFSPGAMPHLAGDHGAAPERIIEVFGNAGLHLERRVDDWGGMTYLLAFRRSTSS
jgi:ubiquinone/menaquinone biosynthesis C-methylase UbiE